MKFVVDEEKEQIQMENGKLIPLYSKEGFEIISDLWTRVGWNEKYSYTFTWMGRPIIQLPEDMVRTQEVIYRLKPDVMIETGIAHGGSLIYYASLFEAMGNGRVIGIDIEIRKHNKDAVDSHFLHKRIQMIEGSSTDESTVKKVTSLLNPEDKVMVILDSDHSRSHVLKELNVYQQFVTPGFYIVATDGLMRDLTHVPRGKKSWHEDNPCQAAREFLEKNPNFVLEQPEWLFNESKLDKNITHWPDSWLRRLR